MPALSSGTVTMALTPREIRESMSLFCFCGSLSALVVTTLPALGLGIVHQALLNEQLAAIQAGGGIADGDRALGRGGRRQRLEPQAAGAACGGGATHCVATIRTRTRNARNRMRFFTGTSFTTLLSWHAQPRMLFSAGPLKRGAGWYSIWLINLLCLVPGMTWYRDMMVGGLTARLVSRYTRIAQNVKRSGRYFVSQKEFLRLSLSLYFSLTLDIG